jgi:hypothetical protein
MPPAGGKITPIDTATTQPTVFGRLVDAARYVITGVSPNNWFGPLDPLQPLAPPEVKGRQWDFPVGININYIPRGTEAVSFDDLRGLAYSLPLLRAVIETRKDQIASLDWIARPRDEKKGGKKTKAADDPASRRVAAFLRRPDQQHPFSAWLRMILEELLVTDAVTLYPRKTRGGGLWAVEQIDGATIKPLINQDGRRPMPPDPAYQQILKGVPAADFSSEELIYAPRNPRVHSLGYGFSPVEQVILTVNIALRRDVSTLEYYKSGSVPDAFGTLPKEYTVDQIKAFQDYFDALMVGDLARRRGLKFMPDTFKLIEARQPPLKDQYDEWLARIICYAFSVPISPFVNQVNRATGETLKLQATQEGLQPTKQWLKELLDLIIQQYLGEEDVEFAFNDQDENDPLQQAQTITTLVKGGVINRNEGRDQLGLEAIDGGDEFNIEVVGGLAPITVEEADTAPPPVDGEAPPAEAKPDAEVADGQPPQSGKKQGVGKAAAAPFRRLDSIAFPRAATRKAANTVNAAWTQAFARQAKSASASVTATLSKLGKAPSDEESEDERRRDDIDAVVADLDLALTAAESDDLRAALADVASDASRLGYAQVGLGDIGDDLFEQLNEAALAWAEDHAAELVSQIGDTTREAVRQAIVDGLDGNLSTAEIADAVAGLGVFGEARSLLIAETEIADANSKGALDGYKAARADGVAVLKEWLVDGNPCEACQKNADAGPIDLDDDFPSGDAAPTAHPRCECALAPVVAGESEKFVASWAMSKASPAAPGREALDALYEQTAQLVAAARIDRSYDVPYLSNRSKDGLTVYIDRRIPKTLKCGIAPAETLPWHELAEWSRQNAGDAYQVAHRQWADPIERRRVAELGGDWAAYSEEIAAYVREVDDEDVKSVPPDLDLRPYQDESDRKALSELARQK